jgi:hypothetical protein
MAAPTCTAGGGSEKAACSWLLLLGCAEESARGLRQSARRALPARHVVLAPQLLQRLVLELLQLQHPQSVFRIRIRNRIQIRKRIQQDPKLMAGSGSDPEPK